jgi:hypothetical protein
MFCLHEEIFSCPFLSTFAFAFNMKHFAQQPTKKNKKKKQQQGERKRASCRVRVGESVSFSFFILRRTAVQ